VLAVVGIALPSACGRDGVSTTDVQAAAEQRVRESLGLTEESALFTNVFVGKPIDGDVVLCGTVEGRRADGTVIPPRRFIAATEPARWIRFETARDVALPSQPNIFVARATACAGEEEVK
jgi:hypothetical protein